ncbi:hypothetical protein SAMN06296241_2930 [Salinimicrobium sediminis]|uniref:Lipocalin-like domain-containing protein n=1 Tax=Salinimicrobium sediminis TaxID=1343891 RepID=A0A285X7U3_9FLAO|nr:hypothetical protein [Salinimicrobium sediminis]SOC81355.1 hypothetical protein SAMN06296241_2930 [Salinimicrobium sediminis]
MKKFLILFAAISLFATTSCTNDDDNNDQNPIIGEWTLVSVNPTVINPAACTNSSTISVNGDNSMSSNFYLEQNNCDLLTASGSWEDNGNSQYTMNFPQLGEVTGTVNFNSANSFTFTTSTDVVFTFNRQI